MRSITTLFLLISLGGTAWAGGHGHHGDAGDHDADDANGGGGQKVEVCHKPGAHQKTLKISADALDAHLKHGDKKGACSAGNDQGLVGQPEGVRPVEPAPTPKP